MMMITRRYSPQPRTPEGHANRSGTPSSIEQDSSESESSDSQSSSSEDRTPPRRRRKFRQYDRRKAKNKGSDEVLELTPSDINEMKKNPQVKKLLMALLNEDESDGQPPEKGISQVVQPNKHKSKTVQHPDQN